MGKEKYTIVTGAGHGMGKCMAAELAKRKHNLILVSLPHEGLETFAEELSSEYHISAFAYETDLCVVENIVAFTQWVNANFSVNMLINNAGIGGSRKFTDASLESVAKIIQLNVGATSMITHQILPNLLNQKKAHILNISSLAALAPIGYKTVYPASKAFITSFSKGLRYELKETSVTVSVAHPGPMKTTDENSERLDKQGRLGKFISATAEGNAVKCIDGMLKGKKLIVLTPLSYWVMKFAPTRLKTHLVSSASRKEILENKQNTVKKESEKDVKWTA